MTLPDQRLIKLNERKREIRRQIRAAESLKERNHDCPRMVYLSNARLAELKAKLEGVSA